MVAVELCLHRLLVTMCIKFGSGYTASLNQIQFNSSVTATVIVTMRVTMAGQDSLASMQAACKDAASNSDSLPLCCNPSSWHSNSPVALSHLLLQVYMKSLEINVKTKGSTWAARSLWVQKLAA